MSNTQNQSNLNNPRSSEQSSEAGREKFKNQDQKSGSVNAPRQPGSAPSDKR